MTGAQKHAPPAASYALVIRIGVGATAVSADNSTDDLVREILGSARLIALVGASPDPARDSYDVMRFLLRKGYRVIPVNPNNAGEKILEHDVVASLAEIKEPVDMVDIFRRSEAAGVVIDEAIAIGAKAVWTQLGIVNEAAAGRARAAGLKVVMDRCPKNRDAAAGHRGAGGLRLTFVAPAACTP